MIKNIFRSIYLRNGGWDLQKEKKRETLIKRFFNKKNQKKSFEVILRNLPGIVQVRHPKKNKKT